MASGNFLSNDKNRVLLWTNPNPSSAFGTQTINVVNAAKYSLLEVVFKPNNQSGITDNTYMTQFVDVSYNKHKLGFSGFINSSTTSSRANGAYRNLTINIDSLNFENGTKMLFTDSTLSDSYCVVPVKIYGIR